MSHVDPIRGGSRVWWLLVPLALLAACSSGPDYEEITSVTLVDPGIEVQVELAVDVADGDSDGPEYVRIRLKGDEEAEPVYLGEIANDGVELTLDNIRPDPSDVPNLRLCLNGTGQGDLFVRINVKTNTVTEIPRECTD